MNAALFFLNIFSFFNCYCNFNLKLNFFVLKTSNYSHIIQKCKNITKKLIFEKFDRILLNAKLEDYLELETIQNH